MNLEEKLDEALKETFPASDAFWLAPQASRDQPAAARVQPGGAAGERDDH